MGLDLIYSSAECWTFYLFMASIMQTDNSRRRRTRYVKWAWILLSSISLPFIVYCFPCVWIFCVLIHLSAHSSIIVAKMSGVRCVANSVSMATFVWASVVCTSGDGLSVVGLLSVATPPPSVLVVVRLCAIFMVYFDFGLAHSPRLGIFARTGCRWREWVR